MEQWTVSSDVARAGTEPQPAGLVSARPERALAAPGETRLAAHGDPETGEWTTGLLIDPRFQKAIKLYQKAPFLRVSSHAINFFLKIQGSLSMQT